MRPCSPGHTRHVIGSANLCLSGEFGRRPCLQGQEQPALWIATFSDRCSHSSAPGRRLDMGVWAPTTPGRHAWRSPRKTPHPDAPAHPNKPCPKT